MAGAKRPTNKAARERAAQKKQLEDQISRAALQYDLASTLPENAGAQLFNLCLIQCGDPSLSTSERVRWASIAQRIQESRDKLQAQLTPISINIPIASDAAAERILQAYGVVPAPAEEEEP